MSSSFPYGKHCFQCQFLFLMCKLCLRYTVGNFNENLSMRALAQSLRARANEHSSNFASNSIEQRPNFASTFKLEGTIRYPSLSQHLENFLTLNKFFSAKLKKGKYVNNHPASNLEPLFPNIPLITAPDNQVHPPNFSKIK